MPCVLRPLLIGVIGASQGRYLIRFLVGLALVTLDV